MNKLDELIALLCPNGVKYQELAHAVSIERGKRVVREHEAGTVGKGVL